MKSRNPWYSSQRGGCQSASGGPRKPNFPISPPSKTTDGRAGGHELNPSKAMEESEKDLKNIPNRRVELDGTEITSVSN